MHKVIYTVFIEKNVPKFSSTDLKEGCLFNPQELIGSEIHISGIPEVYPWSKMNSVSAPTPQHTHRIHVYLETQNVTLCGYRVFADAVSEDEVTLDEGGP